MSVSKVVAAVKSGELDLDETTSMDSKTSCRVCLNDKQKTSRWQQMNKTAIFCRIRHMISPILVAEKIWQTTGNHANKGIINKIRAVVAD